MSARKAVTSLDVARAAGVSRSAVSRSFIEGASVSEMTRRSVLDAALQPGATGVELVLRRGGS